MFGGTSSFGTAAPSALNFGGGGFTGSAAPNAFGSPQQTTTSLFGSTGGFNANKPAGFTTSFGSPQSTSLFSQPNRLGTNTPMFNSPGAVVGSPFGSPSQAQGTSVPFTATTGSDTMMKNGVASPINTRHQCITCMKEYEQKSLEELRLEDYQLGRKGSAQQNTLFGNTQAQPTGLFSSIAPASNTTSTFGTQQRTPTFGAVTPQTNVGAMFSNLNQPKPNFFGNNPATSTFGTTAPAFSFPNSQPQQTLFAQNTTTPSTGVMGTNPGFTFSQPTQQQQIGLGGFGQKTLSSPAVTSAPGFGFGSQANAALNKPAALFSSASTFPQQSAFPAPAQAGSNVFGTQAPKSFSFGQQPVNSTFGASTSSAPFSFTNPVSSAPAFGGQGLFATQTTTTPSTGFSSFGNPLSLPNTNTGFGGFNMSSSNPGASSTGFSFTGNTFSQSTPFQQQTAAPATGPVPFATTPYKDSPLFYNLITNRNLDNMTKPTNPLAQRAVKEASRRRSSTALGSSSSAPFVSLKQMTFPVQKQSVSKSTALFDGFEEEDHGPAVDILSPKTSVKKLSLKSVRGVHRLSLPTLSSSPGNEIVPAGSASLNDTVFENVTHSTPINGSLNVCNNNSQRGEEDSSPPSGGSLSNVSSEEVGNGDTGMEGIRCLPPDSEDTVSEKPPNFYEHDADSYVPHTKEEWKDYIKGKTLYSSKVICTLPGYYTQPSVPELDLFTDEEGNCFIRGFCVGRTGYGQIRFLDVVNVAGINIDEIVKFRHKEVVVYPDEMVSPPVGEGLNVQAQVRLERIWPTNKDTREPISDPATVRSMKYEELLRRSCERMDAKFVSYDETHGIWVFNVKHFSKYSCVPEENEEEEICPPAPKIPSKGLGGMSSTEIKALGPKLQENYLESGCLRDGGTPIRMPDQNLLKGSGDFSLVPVIEDVSSFKHPLFQSQGGIGDIFFPDDSGIEESFKTLTGTLTKIETDPMDTRVFDGDAEMAYFMKLDGSLKETEELEVTAYIKDNLKSNTLIRSAKTPPPQSMAMWPFRKKEEVLRKKVANPLNLFYGLKADPSSVHLPPRNTHVCFGSNGHFLQILNNSKMSTLVEFNGEVGINKLDLYMRELDKRNRGDYRAVLTTQLNLYLENSSLRKDSFVLTNTNMVNSHIETIDGILEQRDNSLGPHYITSLREEKEVWKLLDILWPSDMGLARKRTQEFEMTQRKSLSRWLNVNGSMLFSELFLPNDSSVKGLLLKGMKLEASRKALKEKNYTLALCLAQNNPAGAAQCRTQLNYWEKNEVLPFINPDLLELYGFCAGYPLWNDVECKRMTTSNWLQHFATFVWYLTPAHLSIPKVLSFFQATVKQGCGETDDNFSAPAIDSADSSLPNLCIHILKMYSSVGYPIHKLLSPKSHTRDALDYKVSWFLLNTFLVLGLQIDPGLAESVTCGFAQHLETLGMWEWAVFILRFLPSTEPRRITIKRILERNISLGQELSKELSFLHRIGVSQQDIDDAKL